jgi:hypothetical protein
MRGGEEQRGSRIKNERYVADGQRREEEHNEHAERGLNDFESIIGIRRGSRRLIIVNVCTTDASCSITLENMMR